MRPLSHFEFLFYLLVITHTAAFLMGWVGEGEEGTCFIFFPVPSSFVPLFSSPSQKTNFLNFTEVALKLSAFPALAEALWTCAGKPLSGVREVTCASQSVLGSRGSSVG